MPMEINVGINSPFLSHIACAFRWLGNGKVPVAVTMADFMQAVKEVWSGVDKS